jgi:hypothetical protein
VNGVRENKLFNIFLMKLYRILIIGIGLSAINSPFSRVYPTSLAFARSIDKTSERKIIEKSNRNN